MLCERSRCKRCPDRPGCRELDDQKRGWRPTNQAAFPAIFLVSADPEGGVTRSIAAGLGAASSSCAYAAAALARALIRRGASFTAAMVFEIASSNLVIELCIILALLISWQFTLAEFVGDRS